MCLALFCPLLWGYMDMGGHAHALKHRAGERHGLFYSIILRLIPLTQDLSLSPGLAFFF